MMYSMGEISPDAMRKLVGNKGKHMEGQCTETLGSTRECDWVVGSQILTMGHDRVGNLREGAGRLANKRTKIAEGTEETCERASCYACANLPRTVPKSYWS